MNKKSITALLTAAVASTTLLASAPSASAADNGYVRSYCVGTKQESKQLINGYGQAIGRVELWYSSANGGQNCVMTYNYAGGRQYTEAELWVDTNHDRYYDQFSYDHGSYNSYAGGTYRNKTNHRCVWFYGKVNGPNSSTSRDDASYGSGWVHCG